VLLNPLQLKRAPQEFAGGIVSAVCAVDQLHYVAGSEEVRREIEGGEAIPLPVLASERASEIEKRGGSCVCACVRESAREREERKRERERRERERERGESDLPQQMDEAAPSPHPPMPKLPLPRILRHAARLQQHQRTPDPVELHARCAAAGLLHVV